jgi:hypothetical protein
MPGHIIQAKCSCGFSRELRPGVSELANTGYEIAYNADESDLSTMDHGTIKSAHLRTIPDPYFESSAGPHLCPRCKNLSLMLHFGGFWD